MKIVIHKHVAEVLTLGYIVDRELFALEKIHVYIFRGGKISRYGKGPRNLPTAKIQHLDIR